jgi:hypothetical protein
MPIKMKSPETGRNKPSVGWLYAKLFIMMAALAGVLFAIHKLRSGL